MQLYFAHVDHALFAPNYELAIAPSAILVVVSIPDLNTPTIMMDPPSPQWAYVGQEHHIVRLQLLF